MANINSAGGMPCKPDFSFSVIFFAASRIFFCGYLGAYRRKKKFDSFEACGKRILVASCSQSRLSAACRSFFRLSLFIELISVVARFGIFRCEVTSSSMPSLGFALRICSLTYANPFELLILFSIDWFSHDNIATLSLLSDTKHSGSKVNFIFKLSQCGFKFSSEN